MKIDVTGLSLCYRDVEALVEATVWDIETGEVHLLVGPNGSGKTSFLRCLSGSIELYGDMSGTITVDTESFCDFWTRRIAHRKGIFLVQQEPALVDTLTVFENIVLGNESLGGFLCWNKEHDKGKVMMAMSESGLEVPLDVVVGSLSASGKQKTAILRALYKMNCKGEVNFLLFDEPTTHLTDDEVKSFLIYLDHLKRTKRIGIIIVSHDFERVVDIVDKVTVFEKGSVVCTYPIYEYLELYRHEIHENTPDLALTLLDCQQSVLLEVNASTVFAGSKTGISFVVSSGNVLTISGPNDILDDFFNFIVGLPTFYSWKGSIILKDKNIKDLPLSQRRRLGIGVISSDKISYGVFRDLTVYQNLVARSRHENNFVYGVSCLANAGNTLSQVKVDRQKWHRKAATLSGGNMQRLVFGREYAQFPSVLVLRHPTQGLDKESRNEMASHLRLLLKSGSGVLLIGGGDLKIEGGSLVEFYQLDGAT